MFSLSVYPPNGDVKVSAPAEMELEIIRTFIISKLSWIKKQQQKVQTQERETPREFLERESHYFQGKRYLLKIQATNKKAYVSLTHKNIVLNIRNSSSVEQKKNLLFEWYRAQLKAQIPQLIKQYEQMMQVSVHEFGIKKMKTKWGTCSPTARRIWVNLELAKKPPECLEYIIVHEMTHLLEPTHNQRFVSLMNKFLPQWRLYKDELNNLPVKHENWKHVQNALNRIGVLHIEGQWVN